MATRLTERDVLETLEEAIRDNDLYAGCATFQDAGILSGNKGLVIRGADGSEFQVQIVRSR